MELLSPVFEEEQPIPVLYTRDGDDISPPLHWNGVPEGTVTLALIMEDPDTPGGDFTHWLIYNLPASMGGIDREVPAGAHYGAHAFQGLNDFGDVGYGGPAPPQGEHHYVFRLFALDTYLPLEGGTDKAILLQAMKGHLLAEASLTGVYRRRPPEEIKEELEKARAEEDAYDRAAHYGEAYQGTTARERTERRPTRP